jgi:hypothetical protein
MANVGARLVRIEPGEVVIELPFREDLTRAAITLVRMFNTNPSEEGN